MKHWAFAALLGAIGCFLGARHADLEITASQILRALSSPVAILGTAVWLLLVPRLRIGDAEQKERQKFSFMGPYGTAFMTLSLPLTLYGIFFLCNERGCLSLLPLRFPAFAGDIPIFTVRAMVIYVGWFAFQALLHLVVPGPVYQGVKLPSGERLDYKCNGSLCFVITVAVFAGLIYTGTLSASYLHDQFLPLMAASIIFASLLSVYLYLKSMSESRSSNVARHGDTGFAVYDFFLGRQLNPRDGFMDWKFFCELRPGLVGWLLINFSMAATEYEHTGSVSASMILVNIFQFIYVIDSQINERSILTTMDIIHDGFGFMLAFGDLAWVPFIYSLQARYLADYSPQLSWAAITGILALHSLGFFIFRASNLQKDKFRNNPNDPAVKHLQTLPTEAGTKLIVSGWWGMSRHINYFGDWIMGVSWCLLCGFGSPIPYFYMVYFAILLIHRQVRDDENCRRKYGKDWDKYCKRVPYRIVPYVL